MNVLKLLSLTILILSMPISARSSNSSFTFVNSENMQFTDDNKKEIKAIILKTINNVEMVLGQKLKQPIQFTLRVIDRSLADVYGVTGRADKIDAIEIALSSQYGNSLEDAIQDGLRGTLFHELHHTIRGWTIHGNQFPQGIDVATINEGLADVFAEIQINREMNKMAKDVNFDEWTNEVLQLPKNANYGDWMGLHPDGRMAVGYRTGAYLVKLAIKNSGKGIVELSSLSVGKIYQLAGYKQKF